MKNYESIVFKIKHSIENNAIDQINELSVQLADGKKHLLANLESETKTDVNLKNETKVEALRAKFLKERAQLNKDSEQEYFVKRQALLNDFDTKLHNKILAYCDSDEYLVNYTNKFENLLTKHQISYFEVYVAEHDKVLSKQLISKYPDLKVSTSKLITLGGIVIDLKAQGIRYDYSLNQALKLAKIDFNEAVSGMLAK